MDPMGSLSQWCSAHGHAAAFGALMMRRAAPDRDLTETAEENLVVDALTAMVENDRIELIGPALQAYFAAPYRVVTDADSPRLYHSPRFARHSADELRITLSAEFKHCPMTWAQCSLLLRIMPLFDATMRGDQVVLGAAILNQWDAGLEPGLSYCANTNEFVLIPDHDYVRTRGHHDLRRALDARRVPWSDRKPVALWRGATTDQYPAPPLTWRDMPRIRLSMLGREHPDMLDAGISKIWHFGRPEFPPLVEAENIMKPYIPNSDFQTYRYQIDIDGSTNAWAGLFTKLLSGSTVLKVESAGHYRQWYYGRLSPWVHFVPVRSDLADLVEKVAWVRRHDDEAFAIGRRGQEVAESMRYNVELQVAVEQINRAFRIWG